MNDPLTVHTKETTFGKETNRGVFSGEGSNDNEIGASRHQSKRIRKKKKESVSEGDSGFILMSPHE